MFKKYVITSSNIHAKLACEEFLDKNNIKLIILNLFYFIYTA